jgi:predicted nucleic acid-binding protein
MAGARDGSELRDWEAIAKRLEKEDRLLVPTSEDWLLAGRVLNLLLRGLKSKRTGRTPKMNPDEKQRIIRDVLIARCVRRANGLLVTNNMKDFERIKKFCNVRIQSGQEFFHL